MAYNPQLYMPMGYQPIQQMYQPQTAVQQAPQMMTPPTIRAEIVQVDGEQTAAQYPVGVGASQMMIARDESAIYIKTATVNGFTLDVYEKRAKTPQEATFDPAIYVRRDEIESLVAAALAAQSTAQHGKREAVENGTV